MTDMAGKNGRTSNFFFILVSDERGIICTMIDFLIDIMPRSSEIRIKKQI